jgi:hypothetical protein
VDGSDEPTDLRFDHDGLVVNDEQLHVLADRIAADVLDRFPRSNALLRYGESRSGVLATAAEFAGIAIASVSGFRRGIAITDPFATERLYAQTVAVDPDRAHADVHYVDQRLLYLAIRTCDAPEELIRDAAHPLVAFVAAGRPADQRLDEVEQAYAKLRDANDARLHGPNDDEISSEATTELMLAYQDAWRRALS